MNNYQQEILNIFSNAQNSIKVAVAWLTDEVLIKALTSKARQGINVDVLLSADYLNLYKFNQLKTMQKYGVNLFMAGSDSPNQIGESFMHMKEFFIDDKKVYGGSYNFTVAATRNGEQAGWYADYEYDRLYKEFQYWWSNRIEYFKDFTEKQAKEIAEKLKLESLRKQKNIELWQKEQHSYKSKSKYQTAVQSISKPKLSERETILINEIKKDKLRHTTSKLATGAATITSSGTISPSQTGTKVQRHKYFGGTASLLPNKKRTPKTFSLAVYQKRQIEKKYDFLKCRIHNGTLICTGEFQPQNCDKYKVRIEFREGFHPQVQILSPEIEAKDEIHMYKNGTLCLYYPPEQNWKDTHQIADYIIPWIVEWILYYEIWKLSGKWEGSEQAH